MVLSDESIFRLSFTHTNYYTWRVSGFHWWRASVNFLNWYNFSTVLSLPNLETEWCFHCLGLQDTKIYFAIWVLMKCYQFLLYLLWWCYYHGNFRFINIIWLLVHKCGTLKMAIKSLYQIHKHSCNFMTKLMWSMINKRYILYHRLILEKTAIAGQLLPDKKNTNLFGYFKNEI